MLGHLPGIRIGLNAHQLQIRSVREADQRHLGRMVAVRSTVDRSNPHGRELRLHLLELASGNGDVIDSRIGGVEHRGPGRPQQSKAHHHLIVKLHLMVKLPTRAKRPPA